MSYTGERGPASGPIVVDDENGGIPFSPSSSSGGAPDDDPLSRLAAPAAPDGKGKGIMAADDSESSEFSEGSRPTVYGDDSRGVQDVGVNVHDIQAAQARAVQAGSSGSVPPRPDPPAEYVDLTDSPAPGNSSASAAPPAASTPSGPQFLPGSYVPLAPSLMRQAPPFMNGPSPFQTASAPDGNPPWPDRLPFEAHRRVNPSPSLPRHPGYEAPSRLVPGTPRQRSVSDWGMATEHGQNAPPVPPSRYWARRPPPPQAEASGLERPEFPAPARWQPDAEATYCPICRTQFSFLVRKHHCRKCGKVVCNSCSPHRITIPYLYISRPPGQEDYAGGNLLNLLGGERVRLCNPCVPDPQVALPSQPGTPARHRSSSVMHHAPPFVVRPAAADAPPRVAAEEQFQRQQERDFNDDGDQLQESAFGQPGIVRYDVMRFGLPDRARAASPPRPLPPPIAEEDECPVCHLELPSRQLPNFTLLREQHIMSCLEGGGSGGGGEHAQGAGSAGTARRSGMFPYRATEKDCVDSAECTICLEEFQAGVRMARLECLCRFHYSCIAAWFENHPGQCPVHNHDGSGF